MPSGQLPFARIAACVAAFWFFGAVSLAAQSSATGASDQHIVAVRVVTEAGAVLEENPAQLPIRPGQEFSIANESAGLRDLFKSGRFADIRAVLTNVAGGVRLDYVVRRNLFINRVQIEGLQEPPSDAVALSAVRLNLGDTFRESDLMDAIDRLRQTLDDEGEYEAKITYELTPHADMLQMDILIHVVPGTRARVGAISVVNQTDFPDDELRARFKLKPGQEITSQRLQRDGDRVRKWLADKDYLSARVTTHRGDYDSKTNTVPLEVTFYAGLQVRLAAEGAKVSQSTLRRLVPVYQEGAADEDLLQEGRRALREWLENKGYFDAQVDYTTSESAATESGAKLHPAERVVTYHINRGSKQRVEGIAFSGNMYFDSKTLRDIMKIHPSAYASPGRYSDALLQDDIASIRTLYNSNGFQDAQVKSELAKDYKGHKGELFVHIIVQEGAQTRIADLMIEGNESLSSKELLARIGSTDGQPYSDFNVSTDRDNILEMYYDQGFPDVTFTETMQPAASSTANAPRVNLVYHITEGTQVRVARVLLDGYEKTRRGVISREVEVHAGDPLSEQAMIDTQRKLYNLGVFSRVNIAPQNPQGDASQKAVVIMLDEAKRYTLAYGLGVEAQRIGTTGGSVFGSLTVSPRITFELAKLNLTGRADTLSFKLRASTIQWRALLSYTAQNYFGKPNLSLELSTYAEKTRDVQTFTSIRYEGLVQLVQKVNLTTSLVYRYAYRHITVSNLNIEPEEIPLFSQPTEVSEVGMSWFRDRRDNPVDASHGDYNDVDIDLASKSIGSSASFLRVFLQNSTYHPIGTRLVFARSFRFGVQTPYGDTKSEDIPLPERFFAGGGTTLRGFGLNQAGPRDPDTGFPVGGQAMLIFNQELRFPMNLPFIGNRIGGAVFYDAGNVYTSVRAITFRLDPPVPVFNASTPGVCLANCDNNLNYFSHTVGFAFRYATPIGPVALDLAYQLNPASFVLPVTLSNGSPGFGLTRDPAFQFFVNLGATF